MESVFIVCSCAAVAAVIAAPGRPAAIGWKSPLHWVRSMLRALAMRGPSVRQVTSPAISHAPGWTLIRCDDEAAFRDWIGRHQSGLPVESGEDPSLGSHVLIELYGCPYGHLDSVPLVSQAMAEAADESGATTVATSFHEFEPFGVSGAVIIQESHYTIHTWPEHEYAAVDLFYCGGTVDVRKAVEVLRNALRPKHMKFLVVRRGLQSEVQART